MKKLLLLFVFISTTTNAQIVNIPDANFRQALLNYQPLIDTNFNQQIEVSEALAVTTLDFTTDQNQFSEPVTDVTGIEAFTNLTILSLRYTELSFLNLSNLTNLERFYLTINFGGFTTIDFSGLTNLKYLTLNQTQSVSSVNLNGLINLEELDISSTGITSVDVNGLINLKKFKCYYNQLNEILGLETLSALDTIYCNDNRLTTLNLTGLASLESLSCANNLLTSIDLSSQNNLISLVCNDNQLTNIDLSNLILLKYLDIGNNMLTSLDVSSLTVLELFYCYNNSLTTLNLNASPYLKFINCVGNLFTTISDLNIPPIIANNIIAFSYGNPQFQPVDFSPFQSIYSIGIWNIPQTQIDISSLTTMEKISVVNTSLTQLDFSNNPLITFFFVQENPDLIYFNAKNGTPLNHLNSNIYQNPNLEYVCANESDLEYVLTFVNQGTGSSPNIHVNSYCSFTPGGNYNTITGNIKFDTNNNGCDALDLPHPNIRIGINDGFNDGAAFTGDSGNYTFYTQAGSFALTPSIENPSWFTFSPATATIPFTDSNNTTTQDFCITANGFHPDVEVVIAPIAPARPGFDATYQVTCKNKGNYAYTEGLVSLQFNDAVLDYVSSSESVFSQSDSNISWSYTNLLPFESRSFTVTFNVNSPIETPAVTIGDVLNFTASTYPLEVDETSEDNFFAFNQTVVGSFDPNDKTCLEGTTVSPTKIGDYLHYNINFENTGTAAATFVVVKDVIDTNVFDINSLQVMNSSHSMTTKITGNKVEFIFEDINLGANEHGNVVFKLKTKTTLVTGNSVTNKAEIYFDYNAPVVTNTVTTTYQTLSNGGFELDNSVGVSPNPASSIITINCNSSIKNIELIDVQGRVLNSQKTDNTQSRIDLSSYSNGIYFVKVTTERGTKIERIIRE